MFSNKNNAFFTYRLFHFTIYTHTTITSNTTTLFIINNIYVKYIAKASNAAAMTKVLVTHRIRTLHFIDVMVLYYFSIIEWVLYKNNRNFIYCVQVLREEEEVLLVVHPVGV